MRRTLPLLVWLAAADCAARTEPGGADPPAAQPSPSLPAPRQEPATKAVVLVTLDGVRPRDVFEGVDPPLARAAGMRDAEVVGAAALVPTLHALAARGVALGRPGHGAPFHVSGRVHVSLPGYTELMTGAPPEGCADNACTPVLGRALSDDFAAGLGLAASEVAVLSSWAPIARVAFADRRRGVLSAGQRVTANASLLRFDDEASRLVDDGAAVDPFPGWDDYRPDRFTAPLALRYYAAKRPRFFWVALGDTDEHAHRGDYRAYLSALQSADRFVAELLALVDAGPLRSATTLVVTTDHGREAKFVNHGAEPESAAIWLVAAGGGVPARGVVALREERALADVAPTLRRLAGLSGPGRTIEELH